MTEHGARTTQGVEEYIEAIWRVAGSGAASTKSLADHLRVTPASVTGMLKRLAALELIEYRPYGKASLSRQGHQLAAQIVRRHRLSERLLTDILGLSWEKAHTEACKFEHLITGEVEQRLAALLGVIDTCPHGHPFDANAADSSQSLTDVAAPSRVRVIAILDESNDFLHYLTELGITLGVELHLKGAEPFADGAVLIEIAGTPHALGRRVAEQIRVTPIAPRRPTKRPRGAQEAD
jgi:DtxR family transcriptional regulator, Mn-dependent transcriptional regulator